MGATVPVCFRDCDALPPVRRRVIAPAAAAALQLELHIAGGQRPRRSCILPVVIYIVILQYKHPTGLQRLLHAVDYMLQLELDVAGGQRRRRRGVLPVVHVMVLLCSKASSL